MKNWNDIVSENLTDEDIAECKRQVAEQQEQLISEKSTEMMVTKFLAELTELTKKYGLAITGYPHSSLTNSYIDGEYEIRGGHGTGNHCFYWREGEFVNGCLLSKSGEVL